MLIPPIKCQGKKSKLVDWIKTITSTVAYDRWIEPFMGSGVVGFNINPTNALFTDTNTHIIELYKAIQSGLMSKDAVKQYLSHKGNELSSASSPREYYESVRADFNKNHDSFDFLFLTRSCFNGLMRFSAKSGFNTPFCKKPDRFSKAYITKICNQVDQCSKVFNKNWLFDSCDFEDSISKATSSDLIYCDPPYSGLNTTYFDKWTLDDDKRLFDSLTASGAKFVLSSWLSTPKRKNEMIEKHWSKYNLMTKEHYYQVGSKTDYRHAVVEVLITNF